MSFHKTRQARTINAAAITALVCITGLSACGGGSDGGTPTPPPVTVPVAQAPSFTSQPQNQSVQAGHSVTFSAAASGTDPLSYQWSRNGVPIPGATTSAYTVAAAQSSDNAAVFSVTVRNAAGSADSAKAALTVTGTGLMTLAGAIAEKPGPDTPPAFDVMGGLSIDAAGNLFVAGGYNITSIDSAGTIRRLPVDPVCNTWAAGHDKAGNVYVSCWAAIYKVSPAGVVTTVAGTPVLPRSSGSIDGLAQDARFYAPKGIAADAAGNVFIADSLNHAIRRISPDGAVTTLAG
ncbi:immunoglobulin domain-containing protein [Massilia scottii]|uniref:immunoglobulin domain-containing protein n=1 Tax=Massilia scottii TaxID=3057166 RepID=UPI0027969DB1|nr:immunoglobulin domain-containing protein [Massilia sp. CCM 9029]MDQ1830275.1 immunoglobulin domain-containing protein [Massilia sp. CCM 9029]